MTKGKQKENFQNQIGVPSAVNHQYVPTVYVSREDYWLPPLSNRLNFNNRWFRDSYGQLKCWAGADKSINGIWGGDWEEKYKTKTNKAGLFIKQTIGAAHMRQLELSENILLFHISSVSEQIPMLFVVRCPFLKFAHEIICPSLIASCVCVGRVIETRRVLETRLVGSFSWWRAVQRVTLVPSQWGSLNWKWPQDPWSHVAWTAHQRDDFEHCAAWPWHHLAEDKVAQTFSISTSNSS